MTKKILFLGGSAQQLAPMRYAKEKGYHVILADYIGGCPGRKLADESYMNSTTEPDTILGIAKNHKIDGIVAYASDPAAYTAAYVADKMGLVGNPPASVEILSRKDLYRTFLLAHGFRTPKLYTSSKEVEIPYLVKPVDSSGSRGISVIWDDKDATESINKAFSFSRCGKVIFEEYIARDGYQIAGDGFIIDGKLAFKCFANEHFDPNGIVPVGESFPYIGAIDLQQRIHAEIQRLLDLLGMKTGALNFDIVIKGGNIYLMEIGPRNGGCLIPEVTKYHTGVDMIAATVESALGNPASFPPSGFNGYYSSYMIHSDQNGVFDSLEIPEHINVVEKNIFVKEGDEVKTYTGSNCILGTMILKFDTLLEMLEKMNHMKDIIKVKLK